LIKIFDVSTSVLRKSLFINIDFSCGIQKLLNEVFVPFKRRKATAELLSWISQKTWILICEWEITRAWLWREC